MKKNYTLFFLFFLSIFHILNAQLPNGDFDLPLNDDGTIPGFVVSNLSDYTSEYVALEEHPDHVLSGKSARFNYTGGSSSSIKQLYLYGNRKPDEYGVQEYIPVQEGEVYELNFYFKTDSTFIEGITNGIFAQFSFKDANDKTVGFDESIPEISSVDDGSPEYTPWVKVSFSTVISPGVTKIAAGIFYRGRGPAWVDNATLAKISDPMALNLDFEIDDAQPTNKPDYYTPRFNTDSHNIENDHESTYLGWGAAKFNGASIDEVLYYYGTYNAEGTSRELIAVCSGDTYTISGFARVSDSFVGSGVRISVIFYDALGNYVSRLNSSRSTSEIWDKISIDTITVPEKATGMLHVVEVKGMGESWFDHYTFKNKNLVHNASFETIGTSATDKPDFWRPRFGNAYNMATIEIDPTHALFGNKAAKFKNSTNSQEIAYYYGPYSADGNTTNRIRVEENETYELSAYLKTENAGNTMDSRARIALIFYDCDGYIERVNSSWFTDQSWAQKTITATVPEGFNRLEYVIEYSGSNGIAWFDDIYLQNINTEWYHPDAPLDTFEDLSYTGNSKEGLCNIKTEFEIFHDALENWFDDSVGSTQTPGTWVNPDINNCPLIRVSANAAIGYLNANEIIPESIYVQRAEAALQFLLDSQNTNGSFPLYTGTNSDCESSYRPGAVMYEGSIATVALLTGHRLLSDTSGYIESAEAICDYFTSSGDNGNGLPPSINANFNGFVIWALSEYNIVAAQDTTNTIQPKPVYLEKALDYFEHLNQFQLENGMWEDAHNQTAHYHGIVTRGLVNLYRLMEITNPDHPKKEVVRHSMYKAINHIIRGQRQGGKIIRSPGIDINDPDNQYVDGFPMESVLMAYNYLGYNELEPSLNDFTSGIPGMEPITTQSHRIATVGKFLSLYYSGEICTTNNYISSDTFKIWPNPSTEGIHIEGEGPFKVYNMQGNLLIDNVKAGYLDTKTLKKGMYIIINNQKESKIMLVE